MNTEQILHQRSNSTCELCAARADLDLYAVPPVSKPDAATSLLLCATCRAQIDTLTPIDTDHWHCLKDSMWTPVAAVQVMAWRMLNRLSDQPWAQSQLEVLYLEDDVLAWAEQGLTSSNDEPEQPPTLDSNGTPLANGDSITLIKDLQVKGAGFTAKRGTPVRTISLTDNPLQIEGRVNGVQVVLLTQFLKKIH